LTKIALPSYVPKPVFISFNLIYLLELGTVPFELKRELEDLAYVLG
jgi:hypothetical protein